MFNNLNFNVMKKLGLILLLSLLATVAFPCGGTWNACGIDDVIDLGSDALNNCCGGSSVAIHDLCTGEAYLMIVPSDGPNSSCANP